MSSLARGDAVGRRLSIALKRTQHALRLAMDDALRPLRITTPQYAVLSAVQAEAGLSNASLARAAFVTAQSMQGILVNLERAGLLERHATPQRGRELGCTLTDAGRTLVDRAHGAVAVLERTVVDAFGEGDAGRIADLLSGCAERLASISLVSIE
ncbi:MAG: MarR family winged helix-turn-helix transcriptional regulator [Janthinobacterium lividum]